MFMRLPAPKSLNIQRVLRIGHVRWEHKCSQHHYNSPKESSHHHRPQGCVCFSRRVSSRQIGNSSRPYTCGLAQASARDDVVDVVDDGNQAVIVLAGGLANDGSLPPWVTRRVDAAADMHRNSKHNMKVVLCGGGTPHKPPPLTDTGHPILESVALGLDLAKRHPDVALEHVLRETASYDTIGNAYYSLVIHALPLRWKHVTVVTSEFHMPRSQAIFEQTWKLPIVAGSQHEERPSLTFHAVSDEGLMADDDYQARCEREMKSRDAFLENAKAWESLGDFSNWLHDTHRCYAVNRQDEYGKPTEATAKELKSY